MPAVVVDASVLIAAFLRPGATREQRFSPDAPPFVAPTIITQELAAHLPLLAKRIGLEVGQAERLLDILLARIQILDVGTYAKQLPEAIGLAREAEAWNDEHYVALALLLDAPIWTYDQDFERIKGIRVMRTDGLGDD